MKFSFRFYILICLCVVMAGVIRAEDTLALEVVEQPFIENVVPDDVENLRSEDFNVSGFSSVLAPGFSGQAAEEVLEDLELVEVDEQIDENFVGENLQVIDQQLIEEDEQTVDENMVDEDEIFEESEIIDEEQELDASVSASGSFGQEIEQIELIDSIVAIVYGPERTRIICDSELRRMGIDGRRRTLPDIILEELMYQQTIKYKIPVDESAIDKYLLDIRRKNNLSLEQVKEIFKRSGYTYQEGREQLAMMYASSTMVELKIMQRLGVTEQEVIAYYEANPIYKEAKYQLERSFIPYKSSISHDEQQMMIERDIIKKGKASELQWGTPFWLKESELSEVMEFVISMNVGDVSIPLEDSDGFEIYRLTAKRDRCAVPLETRFREISDTLKMPKYQEEMKKYRDELFAGAHIVYLIEKPADEAIEFE